MKTKILKEFDERFNWEEIFGKNSKAQQSLRELFIKAIAQTREETIREVLEELPELVGGTTPDQIAYESGYSFCRTTILNKLKQ